MIKTSLSRTIRIIETVQKADKDMDIKLDRELSYLLEHMKYVELMLLKEEQTTREPTNPKAILKQMSCPY